ncbi:MAG: ATP-binding protein [Chloroflexales bacterium]|nr:ATP-binding protein [Chloroflexales bacterium]
MNLPLHPNSRGSIVLRIDPYVRYHQQDDSEQLELLKAAANAALDMIAMTDLGTLKGFESLQRDLEKLVLLEKAGILNSQDQIRLALHRELRARTMILPGFSVVSNESLLFSAILAADPNDDSQIDIVQSLITAGQLHAIDHKHPAIDEICILGGSGATTLDAIGAAFSEITLATPTFAALRDVVLAHECTAISFINTPIRRWAIDQLLQANNDNHIVQLADTKSAHLASHIAALANAGGGVVLLGSEQGQIIGIKQPDKAMGAVTNAAELLSPSPKINCESFQIDSEDLVRVEVRPSDQPPYVLSDGRIMVRRDGQTVAATPLEIRQLCLNPGGDGSDLDLPRSGVSVVSAQRRAGIWHYEVRDLRTTAGVTRDRAQGLWSYAIEQHEKLRDGSESLDTINWTNQIGLWRTYVQGGRPKYDLVHRDSSGVIDHIFYGVSDWGLGIQWQQLINTYAPQLPVDTVTFDDENLAATSAPAATSFAAHTSAYAPNMPALQFPPFQGDRKPRWRGRGAITRIWRDEENKPRFDLLLKNKTDDDADGIEAFEIQEYHGVTRDQLNQAWLDLIQVKKPRTGIEVVETVQDDQSERRFIFRNLRNDEVSPHPWRMNDIEEGSIRQYAARMHLADQIINEETIRWWGNIGYTRPMRRQVDLIFRDEEGVDHIFYAARRDELIGEWHDLMAEYEDVAE